MQSILEQITDWLKSMIISGIMGNLSGMFDSVNQQVGQIAGDVGTTPANFSPAVFSMIRNISESVILPIAGMVLTFIACYELIQMLIEHNNLANFETWTFFKWVFKTFLAVTLISNTFNITMAVFDVAQQVISRSGGLISGSTSVSDATLTAMQATLEGMDLGPLLGLYLQTFVVQVTMLALSAIIFVIVYYGYSDGKVQTFADYVSASEALQEICGRNMEAEKEPATVQPEPAAPVQPDYRVGDTLYLDGKAFTIEKVGLFDVELRDPNSVYPIFRSESKENLARLLEHEENVHLHNLVVDLNPGREKQSEEQKSVIPETEPENTHAENYRINSFHLGEGSPKQKFRANMDAIYTLKTLENQHRDSVYERLL